MKALVVREWSEPQTFHLEEMPIPDPGPEEVLVKIHTAAINFGDTLIASGRYQVQPDRPFTPGAECSGVVEAVGMKVQGYKPGDPVAAIGFAGRARIDRRVIGSCREYAAIPQRNVLRLPPGTDLERAALFRSNYETSYYCLQEGHLKPGETLLVLGAGGGTGQAAVTLGKIMGARVLASASSPEKRTIALEAGADAAIDGRSTDWRKQVEAFAGAGGIDVIFDPVGGDQSELAFRTLGYHGRFLVVGFAAGTIPRLPLNLPLMKAASVVGANMLVGWEAEPERISQNAKYLVTLLAEGKVKLPPVSRRYPLAQASDAFKAVASGEIAGRVVISIG